MSLFDAVERTIRRTSTEPDDPRLIECQDCGIKLDQATRSCPECGSPNIAVYDV